MMLEFIVGALAVYRLAVLLAKDDGPGDWFLWIRTWLGAYDYERPYGGEARPRTNLGRAISCPRCLSVWLAMPVATWVWWLAPMGAGTWWAAGVWGVLGWLALSGAAVWLAETSDKG